MDRRDLSAVERSIFDKWAAMIDNDKPKIAFLISFGNILKRINADFVPKYRPGFVIIDTKLLNLSADVFVGYADFATLKNDLFLGKKFFRLSDQNANDFDIIQTKTTSPEKISGFGFPWVLLIAGSVILSGAIAAYKWLQTKQAELETEYKTRLLSFDRWAAQQPEPVRAAWIDFKKENSKTENEKSVWSQLGSFLSDAGSGLLLAAIAIAAIYLFGNRKR